MDIPISRFRNLMIYFLTGTENGIEYIKMVCPCGLTAGKISDAGKLIS
jgi:hypothetical protein